MLQSGNLHSKIMKSYNSKQKKSGYHLLQLRGLKEQRNRYGKQLQLIQS